MMSAVEERGPFQVITPKLPRLDASVADDFKTEVKALIDKGARRIVIDLSQVQFMDSSGLGALVGCLKYMGAGGVMELANPAESVRKVLALTRMDKVFTIIDSSAHG